jgi:hypothetical protein
MTSTKINDLLLKLCILYFHEKWLNWCYIIPAT